MPDKNTHFDVVIVGAGPAGSTCALSLKDAGLKVALIDKSVFPRDKTCGDAIPGPGLKVLEKLGDYRSEFEGLETSQRVLSSTIHTQRNRQIKVDWKSRAFNSTRLSFDDFLLNLVKKYTSTTIMEGVAVDAITKNEEVMIRDRSGKLELTCDMVIGCDGANSIVSKSFNAIPLDSDKSYISVRGYYENVKNSESSNDFYLLKNEPGYFWIFPVGNGLYNVGIGYTANYIKDHKINIKETFQKYIKEHSEIKKKFINATLKSKILGFRLPIGGHRMNISGERFLLVGDAAYLVDPLQGHGIDKAMQSGFIAAKHIQSCFQKKDFSAQFISKYDDEVYQTLGGELKKNLRIMKLLHQFSFVVEIGAIITSNAKLKEFLQNIFYKGFSWKK